MASKKKSTKRTKKAATKAEAVEIVTDQKLVAKADPLITVRTGQTDNKTFLVKINQPSGRALLIAVHL